MGPFTNRLRAVVPFLFVAAIVFLMHTVTGWFQITGKQQVTLTSATSVLDPGTAVIVQRSKSPTTMLDHEALSLPLFNATTSKDVKSTQVSHEVIPTTQVTSFRFQLTSSFQLPVPFSTLPVSVLLGQQWMKELKEFLSYIDPHVHTGPISLTTSDYKFRDVLLNWLTASMVHVNQPLSHVLVLCMDKSVYDLLKAHDIPSIYCPPESFINRKITSTLKKHVAFSEAQILRLTIMRFLNHWGYDTANYDADAIIMRNPEPLYYQVYKESALIASYGNYPAEIRVKWGGPTLCAGMFMVKSGPNTEIFWKMMNKVVPNSYNDQARLNNAVMKLNVQWEEFSRNEILTKERQGTTELGFNITVLSALKICRQTCNKTYKKEYYVWHKGGSGIPGKMKYARRGGLWYLRADWETVSGYSELKGTDWLRAISQPIL